MPGSTDIHIRFTVNGEEIHLHTDTNRRLLDVLREELGLTGTKEGCSIGECGACTVLVDGTPVNACLTFVAQVEGCEILTIEGIAAEGKLHPLQENFLTFGAVQCGFCTPGMVMTAYALLRETPQPNEEQIKEAITGNLCRCTGYKQIVEAIQQTAAETQSSTPD
jgi:carbon-monoxide dehydrogenase small subunit